MYNDTSVHEIFDILRSKRVTCPALSWGTVIANEPNSPVNVSFASMIAVSLVTGLADVTDNSYGQCVCTRGAACQIVAIRYTAGEACHCDLSFESITTGAL